MLQFNILSGAQAGTQVEARHSPFTMGRAKGADLQLTDPGVWDQHLTISLSRADKVFHVQCQEHASLTVNGEPAREGVLRNGDLLQIGAAKIRVGIAAPRQKSLAVREAAVWFLLGALCIGQVALIYLLTK